MSSAAKVAIAVLVSLFVAASAYVGSCVYALKALGDSARSANGQAVLDRVDLPRLRQSLAVQLLAAYDRRPNAGKPQNALRQLLQSAAPNIADQLVAQILTPERLSELLGTGKTRIAAKAPPLEVPALADAKVLDALAQVRFVSPVALSFRIGTSADTAYFAIMHFEGFEWRLAGIILPEEALAKIVAALR